LRRSIVEHVAWTHTQTNALTRTHAHDTRLNNGSQRWVGDVVLSGDGNTRCLQLLYLLLTWWHLGSFIFLSVLLVCWSQVSHRRESNTVYFIQIVTTTTFHSRLVGSEKHVYYRLDPFLSPDHQWQRAEGD